MKERNLEEEYEFKSRLHELVHVLRYGENKYSDTTINSTDPQNNRTLLHLAATINSIDALKLVLRHFSFVDSVDNRGITPAFLAAEHGLVDNLALLVKKGANVNRKTRSAIAMYKEDTALQLAAENGHVEVVKALYKAGAVADQTALHHAAANNRLEVVTFLLEIGVEDTCLRCNGSFYWLKTKHRFQSKFKVPIIPLKENCFPDKVFNHSLINKMCIDLERNWEELGDVTFGELFDDKHLILCHTALHAAVASGQRKGSFSSHF
ncbi:hypothetical protein OS493_019783 [Desmophyllum pertusum]|uniref:Uncharacterized protein n=1 Tax=Desmophyllum pertusum TaxID=174260 RepID=A0A9W9Z289_9CNID|nr:hypothetical protein OS493_019783 [Desmophyllum pertusum]